MALVELAASAPAAPVVLVTLAVQIGGAARGGESEKRIKSVTTQVERDPNRRDLLGEAPAVLPGVIGEWAREEN